MEVILKNKKELKVIDLDFKGKEPEGIGLPILTGIGCNIIVGHAWFKRIEKISQKYNQPVYKFTHFKLKP